MTEMEQVMQMVKENILTFLPNDQAKEAMEYMLIFLMLIA